jgi:hypothetical protein
MDLVVRNIAELRRCGLKLRTPTFDIWGVSSFEIWVVCPVNVGYV